MSKSKKTCPDCKGSGTYVGFNVIVEDCQRCGGGGEVVNNPARKKNLKKKVKKPSPKKQSSHTESNDWGDASEPEQMAFNFDSYEDEEGDDWYEDIFGLPFD